jgi:methanogenic corrinoid protein MtbC1
MSLGESEDKHFGNSGSEAAVGGFGPILAVLPGAAVRGLAREVVDRLAGIAAMRRSEAAQDAAETSLEALSDALLSSDPQAAHRFVAVLCDRGATVETICLDYLAAAARRLGAGWEDDRLTFVEVTVGLARIQGVLLCLRSGFTPFSTDGVRSALFASTPGEDHTIGVIMATELFRRSGWDVRLSLASSHDALIEAASASSCAVIGLSSGGERCIEALVRLIPDLRAARPDARILVGGRLATARPDMLALLGADALCPDAALAVEVAEAMIGVGRPSA